LYFRGIRYKLNPFFIVVLLLLPLTGRGLETVMVLVIVLIHETSHTVVAQGLGVPVKDIEVFPFGGVARTEGLLEIDPRVEKKIAWAGPLTNFILAGLAMSFYVNHWYWGWWDEGMVLFFIQANLVIAIFNLVPALPLDGGRIFRALLCERYNYRVATEIAVRTGKVLAVMVFVTGVIWWWFGHFNLTFVAAGIFIFLAASREKHLAAYTFLRSLGNKDREIIHKGGLRGEQIVVSEEASILEVLRLFTPNRYHLVKVMDLRSRKLRRELSETVIVEQALKRGVDIPIKKILN